MERIAGLAASVCLLLAGFTALAANVGAQTGGVLYLTDYQVSSTSSDDCGEIPRYAANLTLTSPAEAEQAYLGTSFGVLACSAFFDYNVSQSFSVQGTPVYEVYIGCDAPTTFVGQDLDPVGSTADIRITLQKNGEDLSEANANDLPEACAPGDTIHTTMEGPEVDADFAPDDTLSLEVLAFTENPRDPADRTLFLYVDQNETATRMELAGLPIGQTDTDDTSQGVTIGNATLSANRTQGVAPFPVSFSVNGTHQANASWSLFFDDGLNVTGTTSDLPLTVNHTYEEAGDYTATLNVAYPDNVTRSDTAPISVSQPPSNQTGNQTEDPDQNQSGNSGDDNAQDQDNSSLDGNQTGNETEESAGTPGFSVLVALFASVLAVALRRRTEP